MYNNTTGVDVPKIIILIHESMKFEREYLLKAYIFRTKKEGIVSIG